MELIILYLIMGKYKNIQGCKILKNYQKASKRKICYWQTGKISKCNEDGSYNIDKKLKNAKR